MSNLTSSLAESSIEANPDQRTSLKAVGLITFVIGSMCGCLGITAPLSGQAAGSEGGPSLRDAASVTLGLVTPAVFLITVGFGCFRARRWARPVMLAASWTWLIAGLLGLLYWLLLAPSPDQYAIPSPTTATTIPATTSPATPAGNSTAERIVTILFLVAFMAGMPAAYIRFFSRTSVRATLEQADPKPSWADRCPVPVLIVSLWLILAALYCLARCIYAWIPFFGDVLTGLTAVALLVTLATLLELLAFGIYRLSLIAWWATLVILALWSLSVALTLIELGPVEMYRQAGFAADKLQTMDRQGIADPTTSLIAIAVATAGLAGYLFYVRPYFGCFHAPKQAHE